MRFKKIIQLFSQGNVSVFGLRGSGKDMLTSNVVVRRDMPYVCNVDYGGQWFPLDLSKIDLNCNTYKNFLDGKLRTYVYPYPECCDIYISDAGVYFPAQYCNQLNNQYPYFAAYQALCRHLGDNNFHTNAQALQRVWDKIREQGEQYIYCRCCRVFFHKFVFMRVIIYDQYDAAVRKVRPFSVRAPLFGRTAKALVRTEREKFRQANGNVRGAFLFFMHKSKYDTRFFRKLLGGEFYEDY